MAHTETVCTCIANIYHEVDFCPLHAAALDLLTALEALGAKPEGYCFCPFVADTDLSHTGECQDARDAIAAATFTPGEMTAYSTVK